MPEWHETACATLSRQSYNAISGERMSMSPPAHASKHTVLVLVLLLTFLITIFFFFPVSPVTLTICWLLMA